MGMPEVSAIWIGDQNKLPQSVYSWGGVTLYGNDTLSGRTWELRDQMKHYANTGELNGVADCMRWELLYEHGGIFVDADSERIRNLPEFIYELDAAAAWENEIAAPGLIACGFLKFPAKDPFIRAVIDYCKAQNCHGKPAWITVGPQALTETYKKVKPKYLTILPSHFFFPEHWTGVKWEGRVIYAKQHWGSSQKYDVK
jgi:mannosyltransferase OCH1-like enzyme